MPGTFTSTLKRLHNRPLARIALVLGLALILAQLGHVGLAAARTSVAHRWADAKPKQHSKIKSHRKHHHTAKHAVKHSKKHGAAKKPGAQNPTTPAQSVTPSAASANGAATGTSSPASTASLPAGTVLFNGAAISSWWMNQSASASRTQMVPDPAGGGGTAQQFTTLNTDVAPLTPTSNPRSQLCSPELFKSGQQYWQSFEIYVPTSFTFAKTGWLFLESAVYGAPFNAQPPLTISIENGAFRFQRSGVGAHPFQIAWTTPVVKGKWYRFTWHFDLSASGWVQLYVNDVQQPLLNGSTQVTQLPLATLDSSDYKGPWYSQEQVYFQHNAYQSATIDFKNYAVGTTQAAAESG
jgi:hypothetical protein